MNSTLIEVLVRSGKLQQKAGVEFEYVQEREARVQDLKGRIKVHGRMQKSRDKCRQKCCGDEKEHGSCERKEGWIWR